ncbi:hypothetical protein [Streptomyces sp. WAC04114]|uniref:hypothetical protein n=1 Tax=Streptomyces sp. WAC04114 TaxID=2867961 RepID=UPI001C8BF9BA|nr:hypothetical protein [Streptomyces sp. WAC04114]MBX9362361.1 hypothetical protein [Streptomyces sp. WAC04114]
MTATAEGTGSVLDRARLLKDLQTQARLLEDDLRARTESEPEFRDALRAEYEKAVAAERTAAMYETWRDERVVQIAAAWVLACVFVRFSEDNGLIPDAWLSSPAYCDASSSGSPPEGRSTFGLRRDGDRSSTSAGSVNGPRTARGSRLPSDQATKRRSASQGPSSTSAGQPRRLPGTARSSG